MRTRLLSACLLASAVIAAPVLAQEGHPLKGTWLGDWGPNKTQRTQVFMVLDWDGKNIIGIINPGPNGVPISKATLELQRPAPPPGAPAAAAPRGGGAPPAQGGGGAPAGAARGGGAPPAQGGGGAPGGGAAGGGGRGGGARGGGGGQAPPAPLENWLVHIEADGKDQAGKAVHYVIDGKVENLGLYNRTLVGTWTQGTVKGDFKLTRQ